MTALANREIVAAEGALPVVTARAARSARRRVMVQRQRRGHLPPPRQTRPQRVTAGAGQLLSVLCMTKTDAISRRVLRSAHKTSALMTRAARSDVAAVDLRRPRVTTEASDMSVHSRGNRQTNAAAISSMTRRATGAERRMSRVIELDVEAAQGRKRFHLAALRVRVADRTDLARRVGELWRMTTAAGRM